MNDGSRVCAGSHGGMIRTAFQADPVPDKRASRSIIRGINAIQRAPVQAVRVQEV